MTDEGWRPIETAPKDGTRVLLANNKRFSAGQWRVEIEPETTCLGYNEGVTHPDGSPAIGPRFGESVKNPRAGKVRYAMWFTDNPVAFTEDDEQRPDHDGAFELWEPTHWKPMLEPPHG